MRLSLAAPELARYVAGQLNGFFPDPHPVAEAEVLASLAPALHSLARCFANIRTKYFFEDGHAVFSHLHSDQYAMFLYILSHTAHRNGSEGMATKAYLLNKALHGLDAFYAVEMPEVFQFVHPVGTVLGNARYGNFFTVYQNCTIGSGEDGVYPEFGEGVCMYARSAVIGHCRIGSNVVIGANAFVLDSEIAADSVVIGAYPNLTCLPNRIPVQVRKFGL